MAYYHNHPDPKKEPNEPSGDPDSVFELIDDKDIAAMEQVRLAKLWTNLTWQEIAAKVELSISRVKELWSEYQKSSEFKIEEQAEPEIHRQLQQCDAMLMELWNAWQLSKQPTTREKVEDGYTSKGDILKTTTETIGRLPDAAYMTQILQVMKHRAEILGIKTHIEINFNQTNNQFNFVGAGKHSLIPDEHEVFTKEGTSEDEQASPAGRIPALGPGGNR